MVNVYFTLITECTPESSDCYSVYSVVLIFYEGMWLNELQIFVHISVAKSEFWYLSCHMREKEKKNLLLKKTGLKPWPEIRHTLDPSLLSLLVVPLVRELRSTRSCDFLNRGGGFIKGIGWKAIHRRPPSWTTLVLYSRAVFIFNEPALWG